MPTMFNAAWNEIRLIKDRYVFDFIMGEAESRLVDVDGLPYSLDLLIVEEVDFIQACLRSKTVKEEFSKALNSSSEALNELVQVCICLAQITVEDETMWELDVNIYLGEEASTSANYTPRTASGDLVMVSMFFLSLIH